MLRIVKEEQQGEEERRAKVRNVPQLGGGRGRATRGLRDGRCWTVRAVLLRVVFCVFLCRVCWVCKFLLLFIFM